MNKIRKIEIYSAGCPVCKQAIDLVQSTACSSCDVTTLDLHDPQVAKRAKELGIHSTPAIVIDGKLADCCQSHGIDESTLRSAGIGSVT